MLGDTAESQGNVVLGFQEKLGSYFRGMNNFDINKCVYSKNVMRGTLRMEKKALINIILSFLEQSAAAIAPVLLERLAGYLLPFTFILWFSVWVCSAKPG